MKEIDFLPVHRPSVRRRRRIGRRWLVLIGTGAVLVLMVHLAGALRPRHAGATPGPEPKAQATDLSRAASDCGPQTRPSAEPPEGRPPTG